MALLDEIGAKVGEFIPDIIKGLSTKATPELEARMANPFAQFRGAMEAPPPPGQISPGVAPRGAGVPIADESMRAAVRTTQAKIPMTTPEVARNLKNMMVAAVQHVPELPKDLQDKKIAMNVAVDTAPQLAAITIKHRVLENLTGSLQDKINKANLIDDFIVSADQVANLSSKAKDLNTPNAADNVVGLGGKTLAQWTDFMTKTGNVLKTMPDAVEAVKQYRAITDETWNDMVDRGLIVPERKRTDYFMNQKIGAMQDAFEQIYGSKAQAKIGSILPATLRREGGTGAIETNVFRALHDQLSAYYEHVAQGEFAGHILADPSLNKTKAAIQTGVVPHGYTVWTPKQGQAGFGVMAPESQVLNGLMRGLARDSKQYQGGYVIPTEIANVLDHVRNVDQGKYANAMYKAGQTWARFMTVYNPANWGVNLMSDLPLAMFGMPGERSRALGVLRFVLVGPNGEAFPAVRAAWAAAHGKDYMMRIPTAAGETMHVNVADLARTQGLTTAGEAQAFGGMPGIRDFSSIGDVTGTANPVAEAMRQMKNTIEGYPRIAAGLEALTRTGSVDQFGVHGRQSSLNYGHGAPDWSRVPAFRFLAPFTQFIGLATDRVAQLVKTPGSRGRALIALGAVPVAYNYWNNQNEDYRRIENALPSYDRDNLHFIMFDPRNPSKPLLDSQGQPTIFRVHWFVPEDVLNFFGLGNIYSRIHRVVDGRSTVEQLLKSIPEAAGQNMVSQLGPIRTAIEIGGGRNLLTGEPQDIGAALIHSSPVANVVERGRQAFVNKTPAEGAATTIEQATGLRTMNPMHRGTTMRDADVVEWTQKLRDARTRFRVARIQRDQVKAQDALKDINEAIDNLRRVRAARRAEQ